LIGQSVKLKKTKGAIANKIHRSSVMGGVLGEVSKFRGWEDTNHLTREPENRNWK